MKLIRTISNLVTESKRIYEEACEKGVNEKELDRLEKHYKDSLRLLKMYKAKEEKKK